MPGVPNPSWRVPSRPCPFFSKGNCLFLDACNFVHDVKVVVPKKKQNIPQIYYTLPDDTLHSPTASISEFALDFYDHSYPSSRASRGVEPALGGDAPEDPPPHLSAPTPRTPLRLTPVRKPKPSTFSGSQEPLLFLDELKQYQKKYIPMPITPQDISVFPEEEETPFTLLTLDHATILQHRKKNTGSLSKVDTPPSPTTDPPKPTESLSLPFGSDAPSVDISLSRNFETVGENPMTSTPAQRQALRPLRLPSLISLPPASLESPSQHGATTSMSEGKSTPPLPWASSALDPNLTRDSPNRPALVQHNPFVDNFERPISRGSSLEEYQPHVFPQQYTSDLHWPSVRSSPLSVLSEPFQHSPEDNPSCVPYRVSEHLDISSNRRRSSTPIESSTLPTYYMPEDSVPSYSGLPTSSSDAPSSRPVSVSTMTSIQTTVAPRQRSASSSTTSTSPKDRGRFSSISSHTSNMMSTPITDTASVHERATTESEGSLLASPSSFNMYQPPATQSRRNSSILEALGPIESPPIPAQQVLEMPNLPTSRMERFREQDVIKSRRSSVASLVQPLRASSALAEERSHPIAPGPVQVPSPLDPDHRNRISRETQAISQPANYRIAEAQRRIFTEPINRTERPTSARTASAVSSHLPSPLSQDSVEGSISELHDARREVGRIAIPKTLATDSARRPSPLEAPSIRASIARSYTPSPPLTASSQRSSTSRPHLFFALASDSPNQVEKLLSSGKANANDTAGPQDLPALVFSLTNDQLLNKTEIVKTLLAHGADPSAVEHLVPHDSSDEESKDLEESPLAGQIRIALNPAIRYYIGRPNAVTQGQREALQAGQYEPLLQARFYLIGQDLVLQEMTRAVASHSKRKKESASLSLVLVGPSGHGKSYFASKIGSLLKSPQYIVNMTNLRTQEDLLQAKSLASESDDSDNLQHFLARHEGSRCVVILEEIEKTADKQVLHALLMPWELGKLPASPQLVFNTSPVIWVCTSNAGEELVFECHHAKDMTTKSAREEYLKLMARMRSRLADEIGASIVSRVNAVLPFLPFTVDEQRALASETLSELIAREEVRPEWLNTGASDELVESAIAEYMEREGARSIHRAVQMRFEEGMCND